LMASTTSDRFNKQMPQVKMRVDKNDLKFIFNKYLFCKTNRHIPFDGYLF
jgi:hypothetical protein